MSVLERRRLLAGLLKIELEKAAVINGSLIIYDPIISAYLAIPNSVLRTEGDLVIHDPIISAYLTIPDKVFGIKGAPVEEILFDAQLDIPDTVLGREGTLEEAMLVDAYLTSPDSLFGLEGVLNENMLLSGPLASPDVVLRVEVDEKEAISTNAPPAIADTTVIEDTLDIRCTANTSATVLTGEQVKTLSGDVGVSVDCEGAITTTVVYTVEENEAGGLTYTITTDVYEVVDGTYYIGGRDGS